MINGLCCIFFKCPCHANVIKILEPSSNRIVFICLSFDKVWQNIIYCIIDNVEQQAYSKENLIKIEPNIRASIVMNDELFKLNMELWLAVKYNQFKKARRALAKNASVHTLTGAALHRYDVDENTTLHLAAKQGFLQLVQLLWKYGADLNVRNCFHQTPLHLAAANDHSDVVEFLIEYGADINAVDSNGKLALPCA